MANRQLSDKEVKALASGEKAGRFSVGCGCRGSLFLVVQPRDGGGVYAHWLYRFSVNGQRKFAGLGAYGSRKGGASKTLSEARKAAEQIALDPLAYLARKEQQAERLTAAGAEGSQPSECASLFPEWIECQRSKRAWKADKDYTQYLRLLNVWAAPVIGGMAPNAVTRAHIVEILRPIYEAGKGGKNCTGDKTRQALSGFFEWCIDCGLRNDELNPARDTARIKRQLPTQREMSRHFPACPIEDLPRFVSILTQRGRFINASAMAVLFTILTCSRHANIARSERASEQAFAVWEDIDLEKRLWIIPARKMKCPKNGAHIVPLSGAALAILERLEALGLRREGWPVFHTGRGLPLSNGAMPAQIRRVAAQDKASGGSGFIDPMEHGKLMTLHATARATFASWAAREGFDSELVQLALHHRKDEYGYQRDNATERRREMMEAWARYCLSECPPDWAAIE